MNNAVLVRYSVSAWNNVRNDRKVAAEIAKQKGIKKSAGRYHKCLINSDIYDRMVRIGRDGRFNHVYPMTLPWQEGLRLIDGRALDVLVDKIENDIIPAFNAVADELAANWSDIVDQAEKDLTGENGSLFNRADYPSASDMRSKCGITFTVSPIDENPHFDGIAEIVGTEMAEKLAVKLADEHKRQWNDAAKSVWTRLYKALKHAHDKLSFGKRIYDSDLGNLRELTDLLPVLNIANDPELDLRRKELNSLLNMYSTQAVKDKSVRAQCASEVNDILKKINL